MKALKNIIAISAAALVMSGCQGDLLETSPYGSVAAGNMWTSENLADKGVTAIYSTLRQSYVGLQVYQMDCFGVSADCRDQDYPIMVNRITTSDGMFSSYWSQHYAGIARANDAIVHLPNVNMAEAKKARYIAEAKVMRAYFYYKLNILYKGVPVYLEPVEASECTKGQSSETEVWKVITDDLTDAINEPNLPDIYAEGSSDYGRATKGLAYALRGKAYLYQKEYAKAASDFEAVGNCGFSLFQGEYKQLFKEANEQSPEMILSVQCIGLSGLGNDISFRYGTRSSFGSCWNTYLVSTDFVETYENADGSEFDWDDYIPGYNEMEPAARSVYFFRDGLTEEEIASLEKTGADMSKYLPTGNEERIKTAYAHRDPRLAATIITPYAEYDGANNSNEFTYTLRWPYRGFDTAAPFDLKTDTNNRFYYLFRKFVAEGASEIPNRAYSPIDIPLIRYADILLNLAECYNEMDQTDKAIECVNQVRGRAGAALLNSNTPTTVTGKDNLRERIRNERRWEFNGEGVNFFDEMRWGTWKESKFFEGAGLKQIWGEHQYKYTWSGDQVYTWPAPWSERQLNENLTLADGWRD